MPTTNPTNGVVEYSVKETAAALRTALRGAHPGTKFSVRISRGTGYGWLDVSWTDGPTADQVRPILRAHEGRRFDGTDDSYKSVEKPLVSFDPAEMPREVRWGSCGVNHQRSYSAGARAYGAAQVQAANPGVTDDSYGPADQPVGPEQVFLHHPGNIHQHVRSYLYRVDLTPGQHLSGEESTR